MTLLLPVKALSISFAILCNIAFSQAANHLTEVVKDSNGNILNMSQYDAHLYCRRSGTRLPTIREVAEYAADHGAQGIEETNYPRTSSDDPLVQTEIQMRTQQGYDVIYATTNNRRIVVDFYFNSNGYSATDDCRYQLWLPSSTIDPITYSDAYSLRLCKGFIAPTPRNGIMKQVRCIQSH